MHRSKPIHITARYQFGFNGQLKDNEIYGKDLSYGFDDREYDPRRIQWWKTDKASALYPSLSPYTFVNNNPIWLVGIDGKIFDYGNMTQEQKAEYESVIKILNSNELFAYYYKKLEKSSIVYTVQLNKDIRPSGQYDTKTKTVSIRTLNTYVVAQELFHAYQDEGNFYDMIKSKSNVETEGDIMSNYIMSQINSGVVVNEWMETILQEYGGAYNVPTSQDIESPRYYELFQETVDKRIDYYKEQTKKLNTDIYKGYTQNKTSVGPEAMKKIFREVEKTIVGPRLENGDYYPEK